MSAAQLKELVEARMEVVPLTVDQYHRMIEEGILAEGEPIELLDGFLVRKDRSKAGANPMTVGHEHVWVIKQLTSLLSVVDRQGCHAQFQQPIAVPPDNEPEPDAAIVLGPPDRYRHRHPEAQDVICVIEVADSSLHHDRTTKQRIYAGAGIKQYVIINLPKGIVEEYRQPTPGTGRYGTTRTLGRGETLSLDLGEGRQIDLPVESLLP
jgi:Uma2 family endonuclease